MKPTVGQAIASALAQTRRDLEVVVVDSGQWIGGSGEAADGVALAHRDYAGHPLVTWVTTGEQPGLPGRVCPVAWATNRAIEAGCVRGRYVCTFYDDDLYRPRFMEVMAGYLDEHPEAAAVCCSQARTVLRRDSSSEPAGEIRSPLPRRPGQMDCQVDGAMVMFRRGCLDEMGPPWIPEEPASCGHSDGLFLEKLARVAGIIPGVDEILCEHRYTPYSTYTPS